MTARSTSSTLSAFGNILGSTAVAQLLLLASTPLLMHRHDEAAFGVFGTAAALALVASVAVSLRLDHSLHLSDRPQALLGSCLQIILLGSSILAVPVLALAAARSDPTVVSALAFAVSHAVWTTTTLYLNRENRFRAIALQNLLPVVIFIGGALWGERLALGNALMFWQATAYVMAAASGLFLLRGLPHFDPLGALGSVVRRYRDDLRFLVPARLLALLSSNITVLGSAWLYGPELAGLVVVANRISRAPVRVLGNGMSNVLRASIMQPGALHATFTRVGTIAAIAGIAAVVVVALLPERLYPRLFGDGWGQLAPVLVITTVAAAFQLLAGSVDSLLNTYEKRASFHVNVALFGGGCAAIGIAVALDWTLILYLWSSSLVAAVVFMASFLISYRIARRQRSAVDGQSA